MCYRSKYLQFLCASVCAISFVSLRADDPSSAQPLMPEIMPEISFTSPLLQNDSFSIPEIITPPSKPQRVAAAQKPETPFSPFTGKIKAKKVRLRLRPD